jgi:hemoglobin-like flavoprotein
MDLDIEALRDSFELIAERNPTITARFYEILFERYPQAKRLFGRNSQKAQEDMLTRALAAVLDHLEDAPWLSQTLQALGAKHVGYGVTEEMYDWVGECLLAALGEAAGPAWTPRVQLAWRNAYAAISGLMLTGARTEAA